MKIKVYINELQYRLFFACTSFTINTCIIYFFKEEIIFILGQHQNTDFPHFITTNLPEVLFCFIKLSIFLGLYFTFPIILFQCWFFLSPALYKYEHQIIKNFLIVSICLYNLEIFLIYKTILPYCWKFFSSFELSYERSGVSIHLETRLYEYLNLFIQLLYTLNITTNFCLFLSFFLLRFPITTLINIRKLIYFFCFVLSTLVTPPDITSQIFIGVLFMIIYESMMFSIFLTKQYKKANNGI